eukprot:Rmarinus@m.14168
MVMAKKRQKQGRKFGLKYSNCQQLVATQHTHTHTHTHCKPCVNHVYFYFYMRLGVYGCVYARSRTILELLVRFWPLLVFLLVFFLDMVFLAVVSSSLFVVTCHI